MFSEEKSEVFLTSLYLLDEVVLEPLYTFALLPETILEACVLSFIDSETVLLAAHPLTKVQAAVCPLVNTIPVFLIILILAHVASTIGPGINSHTVHIII